MRRALLFIALAGCGFRIGAGSVAPADGASDSLDSDGGDDAPIDTPLAIDAAIDGPPPPPTCYDRWLDNTIRFGNPALIGNVNSTSFERDPFLSADELTLYFSTARVGSQGGDIWIASRSSLTSSFGTPTRFAPFSTAGNETKASITANGLYAVIGSDQAGGAGGVDVWESTRTSTSVAWSALVRTRVMMVDTAASDHDPMISADGLHVYAAPSAPGAQHIVVASRTNVNASFGAPVTIIDSGANDGDPSVTPDERILVFYSGRTGAGFSGGNIWYATRANATAAWGTPRPVPDVNTNNNDGDPHLSTDGCRLYFGRDGGQDWDLYVTTAQ